MADFLLLAGRNDRRNSGLSMQMATRLSGAATARLRLTEAKRLVKHEMEGVGKQLGLSVPLKVDLGTGHNWRVAHP